jgi:poly-gamma-glutamate capsule biosynthesis protein CapA/YwtB (metallophosphatase superfamily)
MIIMRLLLVGDIMLGRLVNETLKSMPPTYPWGNTLSLFKASDLRIGNLECVLSDRGEPWSRTPKTFHFRTDAKNGACLKAAGLNFLSLANNHSLDYEYEALLDMLACLEKAEVRYAGAGADVIQASRPALLSAEGTTIAVIAFTDNEPDWEATNQRPGIYFVPLDRNDERALHLFDLIRETKSRSDLVVVSAHWGTNWGYQPEPGHVPFARMLVDSGADIVFGHSCHVFRGIEIYKERLILYSLGDFVDDYAVDEIERNDESFIFVVETYDSRITGLTLHPTVISHMQVRLASPLDAVIIAGRMQRLCDSLGTLSQWNDERRCLEIKMKETADEGSEGRVND